MLHKSFLFILVGMLFFLGVLGSVSATTYSSGSDLYGILVDSENQNITGALNLSFQFTTCSLSDCSDANFSTIYTNSTFSDLSSLNNASYFQYRAIFSTENQNYTPYLFNVTIDYTHLDVISPLVDFVAPTPLNDTGASEQLEINLSIIEDSPANLTYNWNGTNTSFSILESLVLMLNLDNRSVFGENDSRVVDASLNSYIGIVKNALWNSSGKYGGAFEFEGNSSININQRISCPEGMAYINKLGGYCIDKWQASMPSANSTDMGNDADVANRNAPGDMPAVSQPNVIPWVRISQGNARTACANAGKDLCTSPQWLGAANVQGQVYYLPSDLAVAPYYCVTGGLTRCSGASYEGGSACPTGTYSGGASGCYSSEGVYDMTGNVWEWTNETVTSVSPSGANWYYLGDDLQWSTSSGVQNKYSGGVSFVDNTGRAVLRGGAWDSGANAGPFSARLLYAPTFTSRYFGFRCCSN